MLGERQFKDNLERSVDIMKYIESYSELSKRISEIEEKSSYDLFVKLYGSNISLKNELEQINSRYLKLYELAFEKSEYVEQLYNIRKLLNKPEIKILMLLSRLDSRFPQSSIEQVLIVASNNKYSKVDDVYFDYNSLIEVINKDKVNKQILNDASSTLYCCSLSNSRIVFRSRSLASANILRCSGVSVYLADFGPLILHHSSNKSNSSYLCISIPLARAYFNA